MLVAVESRHPVCGKAAATQVKRQRVISAVHVCVYLSACTEYLKTACVSGGCVSQAVSVSWRCGGVLRESSAGIEVSKITTVGRWTTHRDPAGWHMYVLHPVDLHCVRRQPHLCSLLLAAWCGTGMSHFLLFIPTLLVKDALALQGVHLLFLFFLNDGNVFVWSDLKEKGASPCYWFLHLFSVFFLFCDVYSLYLFWQKQQLWTVERDSVSLISFFFFFVRCLVYLHLRSVNHQVCTYVR